MTGRSLARLYLRAVEALAAALDAARKREAALQDEAEYWTLVADGIKHSHRCPNHAQCSPDDRANLTPCYRCRVEAAERLLRKYLNAHCAASDAEGTGTLCECQVCRETRAYVFGDDRPPAGDAGGQSAEVAGKHAGKHWPRADASECDSLNVFASPDTAGKQGSGAQDGAKPAKTLRKSRKERDRRPV